MRMRKENVDERKKNEEKIAHSLSLSSFSLLLHRRRVRVLVGWSLFFTWTRGVRRETQRVRALFWEKKKRKFREDEKWCLDFSSVLL